jgi:hypothetical protein
MLLSRQIGSHDVVLECADAYSELAGSVLDTLAELDRAGPQLRPGSTVQFGWSLLTLKAEDDKLRVCEPDFSGDVSRPRPNIDTTLSVLKEQVSVLRAVGEEGVDVRFTQFVAVGVGAMTTPDLFLKRDAPVADDDSGWFVGRLEDLEAARSAEEVDALRIWEVLKLRPVLVQVMALPPGYVAIVRGSHVEALLDKDLRLRWGRYPRELGENRV